MKLANVISYRDYMDLLKLTHDIRLEREKKEMASRGELHPEERRRVEKALDKTLDEIGAIEIDGITFNEQEIKPPVSKRRNPTNKQETRATSQGETPNK